MDQSTAPSRRVVIPKITIQVDFAVYDDGALIPIDTPPAIIVGAKEIGAALHNAIGPLVAQHNELQQQVNAEDAQRAQAQAAPLPEPLPEPAKLTRAARRHPKKAVT